MKIKFLPIFLTLLVSILAYQIQSFEIFLMLLILISFIFLIPVVIRNYFKRINPRFIKIPLFVFVICLAGILVSLFRPYQPAILNSGSISEKLEYAHSTDQNDRKQLRTYIKFLSEIEQRDSTRLKLVYDFYEQEEILKPIDKFYAAFVFHHGNKSRDYEIAAELAAAAAIENDLKQNYQVQWLAKSSYDRWMLSIGKEEKYNTQNKFSVDLE